jgi:hypothetical protein
MKQTIGSRRKIFYSKLIFSLTIMTVALHSFPILSAGTAGTQPETASNYSRLVQFIRLEDKVKPVYVFNDFEETIDKASIKDTRRYFSDHKDLIRRIRRDLGGGTLRWKLDNFKQRLVFVPETREEYATLYKNYCIGVIDFILNETRLDNPYTQIKTLQQEDPDIPGNPGITVFLVHNLAREYCGTYSFFNENPKKKVKISLRGTHFIGEIGSYSSMLEIKKDGTIEFVHNTYTIWQNSAQLPYNALIVPIEETLHIALRPHTEKAIRDELKSSAEVKINDVEQIVEQWVAVEEALVGGLVNIFFPKIVSRYLDNFPLAEIERGLEAKLRIKKYRHLLEGIRVLENTGHQAAVDIYTRNPNKIREMLIKAKNKS